MSNHSNLYANQTQAIQKRLLDLPDDESAYLFFGLAIHDASARFGNSTEVPFHEFGRQYISRLPEYRATSSSKSVMEVAIRALVDEKDPFRAGQLLKNHLLEEQLRANNEIEVQKNRSDLASRRSNGGKATAAKRATEATKRDAIIKKCQEYEKKGYARRTWAGRIADKDSSGLVITRPYANRVIKRYLAEKK